MRLKKQRLLDRHMAAPSSSSSNIGGEQEQRPSFSATNAAASMMHLASHQQHRLLQQHQHQQHHLAAGGRASLPLPWDLQPQRPLPQQQQQQQQQVSPEDPNSALHRLAEAAERKQVTALNLFLFYANSLRFGCPPFCSEQRRKKLLIRHSPAACNRK